MPIQDLSSYRPIGCPELLRQFESAPRLLESGKIAFGGVGDRDVYNIAAPVTFRGETLIAGRVEPRETEHATIVLFRREPDNVWRPRPGAPQFEGLQDPCVTVIDAELVLGGVRFPIAMPDGRTIWRMDFYRGRTVEGLERFLTGPDGMKDIRLAGLPDGRVALFSRPHCGPGFRGRIGFTVVESLEALDAVTISGAPVLSGQFTDTEWGGVNEAHRLSDGRLGLLGHIAWMETGEIRHYYAMAFAIDPWTAETEPVRIIATRAQFPPGPAKRSDLVDVIFAGGIVRHWNGTATLFTGLSDAETGYVKIEDPWSGR
ncbi:MAG TPA: DUF1861 family protein [Chthonomonadaceae bacterium]|nr:DUF1861 family protein [Chthonomonadaceae bacterium]